MFNLVLSEFSVQIHAINPYISRTLEEHINPPNESQAAFAEKLQL